MSDLINRSALIKKLREKSVKDEVNTLSTTYTYKELAYIICNMPTAYDVDKVVAELEQTKKTALDKVKPVVPIILKSDLQECIDMCFDESIALVRKGGME